MDNTPVIFLAFANSVEQPLPQLQEEDRSIYRHLAIGEKALHYTIYRDSYATITSLTDYLTIYKDQVVIFHYGGHAESHEILLEGSNAQASGIAKLLAEQRHIKLVFLNGCSTQAQVALLMELGIPCVLATSSPIDDHKAYQFSNSFYQALSQNYSIKRAFNIAKAALESKTGFLIDSMNWQRGAGRPSLDHLKGKNDWVLYYHKIEDLNWQLPQRSFQRIVFENSGITEEMDTANAMNKFLIGNLTNSLFENQVSGVNDLNQLGNEILKKMPTPISKALEKLLRASDGISKYDRLELISFAYETVVDFIAFCFLSELWDLKTKHHHLEISNECKLVIKEAITKSSDDPTDITLDKNKLIKELHANLKKHDLFIKELKYIDQLYLDEKFSAAVAFLEVIRQNILSDESIYQGENLDAYCIQAEEQLAVFLKGFDFIINYELQSIKSISIINPKHKSPVFKHKKVALNYHGEKDDFYPQSYFTDERSIILSHKKNDPELFLNLSPFIIDRCALNQASKSKIYLLKSYDPVEDLVVYDSLFDENQLKIATDLCWEEKFRRGGKLRKSDLQGPLRLALSEIKQQLDEFLHLFFGKTIFFK